MSEIRVASYGQENYPRAGQVRSTPQVSRVSTKVAVEASAPSQNTPHDTLKSAYYDPHANQMMELRRRAAAQGHSGGSVAAQPTVKTAPIKVELGYPVAPGKQGSVTGGKGPASRPTRTARIDFDPGYPQASAKSGHVHQQVSNTPTHQGSKGSSKAPSPDYVRYFQVEQQKYNANTQSQVEVRKQGVDVQKARASASNGKAAKPQANVSKPAKTAPKSQVKKPASGSARKAAGGAFTAVSGAVTFKNGVKNLANGNYTEGGLQVTQGGLSLADGINDLNLARKGLSNAPAGALTKRLKVGGSVVNAGMAAYDTKQAYHAFKNGNQVAGAEKASSAVINAVSAFPPTAVIGAVGGVADWAMHASGADDAMVRALTSGKDKAYQKQIERDLKLARTLVKTPTATLARCNQEQKQAYIRGIEGLKEYRQHYASQGKTKTVQDIDAQIARIKKAWTR